MATTEIEASAKRADWLSRGWRTWEKISAFLAIIALVDLTKQLIEWARVIRWTVEKYTIVREWLFGWLPFHIPPEWHHPIVLSLILLSVANAGVYRQTGHTLIVQIVQRYLVHILSIVCAVLAIVYVVFIKERDEIVDIILGTPLTFGTFITAMLLIVAILEIALLAWRWVLTTAAIFGVLVVVNEVYVLSLFRLEPPAEH